MVELQSLMENLQTNRLYDLVTRLTKPKKNKRYRKGNDKYYKYFKLHGLPRSYLNRYRVVKYISILDEFERYTEIEISGLMTRYKRKWQFNMKGRCITKRLLKSMKNLEARLECESTTEIAESFRMYITDDEIDEDDEMDHQFTVIRVIIPPVNYKRIIIDTNTRFLETMFNEGKLYKLINKMVSKYPKKEQLAIDFISECSLSQ